MTGQIVLTLRLLLNEAEVILPPASSDRPCPDGATSPITSGIEYFREEFEAGMHTPWHELFPPERNTLFSKESQPA